MSTPRILYLARHGESEWNHRHLVTGQLDPDLSPRGLEQSHALAQCLRDARLDVIRTSRLRRTIATARATAVEQALPIEADAGFDEIHMGVLQGRRRDATDPEALDLWGRWQSDPWGFTVPGGEPLPVFAQRVDAALRRSLDHDENRATLLVGHRATNRVILGTLLRWPKERWHEIAPRHKHLYRIDLAGDAPRIDTIVLGGRRSGTVVSGLVM